MSKKFIAVLKNKGSMLYAVIEAEDSIEAQGLAGDAIDNGTVGQMEILEGNPDLPVDFWVLEDVVPISEIASILDEANNVPPKPQPQPQPAKPVETAKAAVPAPVPQTTLEWLGDNTWWVVKNGAAIAVTAASIVGAANAAVSTYADVRKSLWPRW